MRWTYWCHCCGRGRGKGSGHAKSWPGLFPAPPLRLGEQSPKFHLEPAWLCPSATPHPHFFFCGHLLSLCGWWKGCYFGLPPPPLNRGKSFGGHPGQTQLASKLGHSGAQGLHAMSVTDLRLVWPCSQQVHLGRTRLWSPGWSSESRFQASARERVLVFIAFLRPCGQTCSPQKSCAWLSPGTHKWGGRVPGLLFHRKDPDSAKLSLAEAFHLLIKHIADTGLALKQRGQQTLLTILKKAYSGHHTDTQLTRTRTHGATAPLGRDSVSDPPWKAAQCLWPTVAPSHQERSPVPTSVTNTEFCFPWSFVEMEPENAVSCLVSFPHHPACGIHPWLPGQWRLRSRVAVWSASGRHRFCLVLVTVR